MQTFLPYASYNKSARVLDSLRLGKQRVEGLQIIKALLDPQYGWQHHPAVKMWRGHGLALADYTAAICAEWQYRGFKDTVADKVLALIADVPDAIGDGDPPRWFGDERVHASHRSNLLRKNPEWYSQYGWTERDDLPYVWLTNDEEA